MTAIRCLSKTWLALIVLVVFWQVLGAPFLENLGRREKMLESAVNTLRKGTCDDSVRGLVSLHVDCWAVRRDAAMNTRVAAFSDTLEQISVLSLVTGIGLRNGGAVTSDVLLRIVLVCALLFTLTLGVRLASYVGEMHSKMGDDYTLPVARKPLTIKEL